jgi:CRISPR-associated protein (TIGR02710 family)
MQNNKHNTNNILLITVGGNSAPIITAISATKPNLTIFICTEDSCQQVSKKGLFIKANFTDKKPTLPNIPTQAKINNFQTLIVPADDLNLACSLLTTKINQLLQTYPQHKIIADYTGGTKTMSASLVVVSLQYPQIQLNLTTGERLNLIKVSDNTQISKNIKAEQLQNQIIEKPYLLLWKGFFFNSAAIGFKNTNPDYAALCDGFALWDDFKYQLAYDILKPYKNQIIKNYNYGKQFFNNLIILNNPQHKLYQPLLIIDLYQNCLRCVDKKKYDDAVIRIYRMMELTAQWMLEFHLKIKTCDIDELIIKKLPKNINIIKNKEGKYQAGLWVSYQIIIALLPTTHLTQQIKTELNTLRELTLIRNNSILSHGFSPVWQKDWKKWQNWLKNKFLPVIIKQFLISLNYKVKLLQLPNQPINTND